MLVGVHVSYRSDGRTAVDMGQVHKRLSAAGWIGRGYRALEQIDCASIEVRATVSLRNRAQDQIEESLFSAATFRVATIGNSCLA